MVVYVLWIFTSAWAVQVGTFPNAMTCAVVALQMTEAFEKPPRAFASRMACIPAIRGMPAVMRAPLPDMGTGA